MTGGPLRMLPALLIAASPAAAQDNAGLDRLTTREELRGWEAVGRVEIAEQAGGGFCTGTLIAPDLVLTAGHCVIEPDGAPVPAEAITFRAALADGTALAEAAVKATAVDPAYSPLAPPSAEQVRLDVALLQLASPIPTALIAPFGLGLPGPGSEVSVVSYAAGREEALSWQRVCGVVGRDDGLIAVDCDVGFGSSGAPVLDRSGYRARVVSIISAGHTDENGLTVAFGMELPGIVAELKGALRNGRATSEAAPVPDNGRVVGKRVTPGDAGFGDDRADTGARFVRP